MSSKRIINKIFTEILTYFLQQTKIKSRYVSYIRIFALIICNK